MGQRIDIQAAGIGPVGGWLALPEGAAQGALVVVQEIFGVNAHIREVVDGYAREGFVALAPAFFDPIERNVELGYEKSESLRGRELAAIVGFERAMAIVDAAAQRLRDLLAAPQAQAPRAVDARPRVGAVGFCWGGTVAYLANTRLGLPAVSYYGARSVPFLNEPLRAPMMFHFGDQDPSIPAADIAAHREKQPQAAVHVYPAGHAFNRAVDAHTFVADSAALAQRRTLEFFRDTLR